MTNKPSPRRGLLGAAAVGKAVVTAKAIQVAADDAATLPFHYHASDTVSTKSIREGILRLGNNPSFTVLSYALRSSRCAKPSDTQ